MLDDTALADALDIREGLLGRVIFRNAGLIDVMAIKTFGLSAKVGDNPIGEFGTGLKHAIAMILRAGDSITIWRGTERLDFDTTEITTRGKSFKVVRMNGEALGFTLDLGKGWEPWMALREIYCNCIDESGDAFWSDADPVPEAEITTIEVRGPAFMEVWEERSKYFLESRTPLFSFGDVEVYAGESQTIFYRGVAVQKFEKNLHGIFTYNITSRMELTEDRIVKYSWEAAGRIAAAIQQTDRAEFIEQCLGAPETSFEGRIDFKWHSSTVLSDQFKAIAHDMTARRDGSRVNKSAVELVTERAPVAAKYTSYKPTPEQMVIWRRILMFLTALDFDIPKTDFEFYERLSIGVYANCIGRFTIMVSRDGFDAGERAFCLAVIEALLESKRRSASEDDNPAPIEIMRIGEKFLGPTFAEREDVQF